MKGGINFEEWKEIVKKNRRSLRSKSNIFRFEPESLTYGAEKAVKSPEYGQVHTITYNVTGMDIPSDWPTEIKSGKTLMLSGITALYGGGTAFDSNQPYQYSSLTGKLTINDVQKDLTVDITITPPVYENASTGNYLYDDWTFGTTEKDNWIAICVGKTEDNTKSIWWGRSSSDPIKWSTELVDTNLENYSRGTLAYVDMDGKANTEYLLSLGIDKYPAAAWASLQFGGLGYLPSAGEIHKYYDTFKYWSSFGLDFRTKYIWSSTEESAGYAFVKERDATLNGHDKDKTSHWNGGASYGNYVMAFCQLSGPCGKPVNNNGHEYVDLGLPSGTLWANMNVGASSETDYGNYYMYGMGSKTYDSTDTPYNGAEDPLDLSKDTARQTWGGDWHMPTRAQMEELIANTTYQWVTNYQESGINGGLFTAPNGAVLFFPAAGYWYGGGQLDIGDYGGYWGSSPGGSNGAYLLNFYDGYKGVDYNDRKDGYSVRPVIG